MCDKLNQQSIKIRGESLIIENMIAGLQRHALREKQSMMSDL